MALISRIARLFKADMHSLLDSIEEPESVLKQAIREMAEAIEKGERQLEDLQRRGEKLNTYRAEQEKSLAETDQQIDLCLRATNEKLGRSMVRRKLEIQKRTKLIERERAALEPERDKLAQELATQKARLASVKEKTEIFVEEGRYNTAEAASGERDHSISDDEVEVAFLAEKERRAGVPRSNG
ncbi:MAG: PspA/IM30 family protein [Gammaproteobacteria bacterium]